MATAGMGMWRCRESDDVADIGNCYWFRHDLHRTYCLVRDGFRGLFMAGVRYMVWCCDPFLVASGCLVGSSLDCLRLQGL